MNLLAFLNREKNDFDTYDVEFDSVVTVVYIDKIEDDYDRFCNELFSLVEIIDVPTENTIIANWSDLIRRNYSVFYEFAKEYWCTVPADEGDTISMWLRELHLYIARYVDQEFYGVLCQFVRKLK